MDSLPFIIFQFAVLIFSVIVHEVSHGLMALRLGDDTAKREGRLTLNPVSHIDPIGSILLPLLMVITQSPVVLGWAKPVPFNPMALYKDFRYGPLKVALAGPFSNLALAIVFGLTIRFAGFLFTPFTVQLMLLIVIINSMLFVFNLMPIPPLDGSKILTTLLPREYAMKLENIGLSGFLLVFIFLFLFSGVIQYLAVSLTSLISGVSF